MGPTLWNFTLDELLRKEWPDEVKIIAYADDLAVIVENDSRQNFLRTAQETLDEILSWSRANKLKVSDEKTVFLINKSPPRVHHRDIRLRIDDTTIKKVKEYKYLGVIIDPKMNFQQNAAYSTTKARRICMALRKKVIRDWSQNTETALRTIYRGALLPIIGYASRVWINRLPFSKVRRKYRSIYGTVSRVISQSYASVSAEAAGVIAGILPVDLEIDKNNCLSELRRGRSATFQNETLFPGQFDTIRHAAMYLKIKAEDTWQSRWETCDKGRITYDFFPNICADPHEPPYINFVKTQVLTGHGQFGCHLKRIGKRECDECDTCAKRDDPRHRIIECPKYFAAQELIHEETRTWPPNLHEIPYLENLNIYKIIADENPSIDEYDIG